LTRTRPSLRWRRRTGSGEARPGDPAKSEATALPLYIDRHDLRGLTAAEVADAHVKDLALASGHGVRFLTYWFDPANGTAFCLADAPSPAEMQAVHRESHGLVANEVIAVAEDDVLRFLGSMREPADLTKVQSAFRTILFTDIAGSTALLNDLGEAAWMDVLREHDLILRRAIVRARGREVKHTGDGIMASFARVSGALRCALAIHAGLEARRASGATPDLLVRIGLAAGEPVDHADDVFGATVNLASRICDAAGPGHTLVAELVHDLGLEAGFSFGPRRDRTLRGFPGRTPVFELLGAPSAQARRRSTSPVVS